MYTNEIVEEFSSNELNEYEQLVCRLPKIDPERILSHDETWTDDAANTRKKNVSRNFQDKLYREYKDFETFREQAVLISERKRYALINRLARAMLCRMPLDPGDLYYGVEFLSDSEHDYALQMITSMHNTWLDKEDISLPIPPALSSEHKKIIESYSQTISSLNLEDESEGTMAYLLYDYCYAMIAFDGALQATCGADLEDLEKGYGKYGRCAFDYYEQMIDEQSGSSYPSLPEYII
ncbi:MAG: hypothetical protein IJI75_13645 [Solobacterium sp.]|nr:hypothetical protein [Solobacterium sp.]